MECSARSNVSSTPSPMHREKVTGFLVEILSPFDRESPARWRMPRTLAKMRQRL